MFYYLSGKLVMTEPNAAAIDVGGVAYRLTVSGTTLGKIAGKKDNVLLYTYLKVQEDAMELFGFADEEELAAFRMLISISGVGPKAAISVLTLLTPEKLSRAVGMEDAKTIAQAGGIGPKTAARIVLELKDKMKLSVLSGAPTAATAHGDGKLTEALNALLVLGYSRAEAMAVLQKLPTDKLTLEECITEALKKLARA